MTECSFFRYKKTSTKEHPLDHCSHGNYYKNANKRQQTKDGGNDEEEQEFECVIMDYERNHHAMAQIKLSHQMGVEYALEVLNVDNTARKSDSKVKVIYRNFENTVSGWLEKKLKEQSAEASEINKKLKDEVIPITRKLWKLLAEMKKEEIWIPKKNNDQGYWMPLISGVPLVLNLNKGKGNLDLNYPVTIIEKVKGGVQDKSLRWLEHALKFWRRAEPSDAGKHPALYDSAEKSTFLALFHRCTVNYGLEPWLDENISWEYFRGLLGRSREFRREYKEILNYNTSNPYTCGSDVVRYTRNALVHFEDTYKRIKGGPWNRGDVVEILDEDLAVCFLLYQRARKIIDNQLPTHLTEEAWREKQATDWNILKEQAETRAELITTAYLPAPVEIYSGYPNQTEGRWNEVTEEIFRNHQLLIYTNEGWMAAIEFFKIVQPPSLWLRKSKYEDCFEAFEANRPRKFLTQDNWDEARKKLKEFLDLLK